MVIWQQFVDVWQGVVQKLIEATPSVLGGLVLVVLMLLVAKVVERLLHAILVRVKFDALLAQAGIDRVLQRVGIRQSLNLVLPRLAYFLLLLLFAQTAADVFGLAAISGAINALFSYLPNAIAAVLVLVVGSAVSQFVGAAVARASEDSGLDFGAALGRAVSALILFIAGVMAVSQLNIDTEMVRIVTICTLSGFALAFGLSFGLGTREVTHNIIAGFYARKIFHAGDGVEVMGVRGTIAAITPTQTLLQDGATVISIANTTLLSDVVRAQAPPEVME